MSHQEQIESFAAAFEDSDEDDDVDFASAFGGDQQQAPPASETEQPEAGSEPSESEGWPERGSGEVREMDTAEDEPPTSEPPGEPVADEEEDDLERAMRSLFPVLPDEEETTEASSDASVEEPTGESGSGTSRSDTSSFSTSSSSASSAETSADAGTAADEPDDETQFEAIKRDVQQRETERRESNEDEKKQQRSSSTARDEDEASTEEIEKIWSILEDMD